MDEKDAEDAAILLIDGKRHYLRVWFIMGHEKDWMGAVFRKPGGPWEFRYRFRYYAGTGNDDDDVKSIYEGSIPDGMPLKEALAGLKQAIEIIREQMGGETHELILNTASERAIVKALQREKWAHFRGVTP